MTNTGNPQQILFQRIKDILGPNLSLAETVSESLNISNDSAYRRIRNEKKLELDEFYLLCKHFNISADEIFNLHNQFIKFNFININKDRFDFEHFLEVIYQDLKRLLKQNSPEIYCIFNELNLFQLLIVPEIAAFKFFFWSKSNFVFPNYKDLQFSLDHMSGKVLKLCKDIMQLYNSIPSIEFMASEALSSMLKQLNYYYEAGYFNNIKDGLTLCDALTKLMDHLKLQAETGYKFAYGTNPDAGSAKYVLYYNDLLIVDNTVLVHAEQVNRTYITSNVVNLLVSDNLTFYNQNLHWAENLVRKSVLISGASEKDRNKYFRNFLEQIEAFRSKLIVKEQYS
jgi:hypothetical protein